MTFFEMRSLVLGSFVGWLTLVGCSGQNVVAGEGKSKTERLQASLPSWCSSTCKTLLMCDVDDDCTCTGDRCVCPGQVDDDCPEDCQEEMARWTVGSDQCAEAGERFQRCVDEQGCAVRTEEGLCSVTEDEEACPRPGDADPPDAGPAGGPNQGEGGAGSVPTPPVTCSDSFGTGGGTGTGYPVLLCEEGRQTCSDGHDYLWYCVRTSETVVTCSCLVDQVVVGGFDPGEGCPSTQQVNQGCGWNLDLDGE
jgi:hypothetical protein